MKICELYEELERQIPPLADESIDFDGIHLMPYPDREARRILVALDPYEKAVEEAVSGGYDILLTHHPLFWGEPVAGTPPYDWYCRLKAAGIACLSFHIRLDIAQGGVNDILANIIGLNNIKSFDIPDIPGLGRIGELPEAMSSASLAELVKALLGAQSVTFTQLPDGRMIKRVAVLGGSASDGVAPASLAGADAIIGGEFKHHIYGYALREADGRGIAIIEASHYYTEAPVCMRLAELVSELIPCATVRVLPCNNTFVI